MVPAPLLKALEQPLDKRERRLAIKPEELRRSELKGT